MLDIKFMRENRDLVLAAMQTLGAQDAPVDQALDLDERRRTLLTQVERLRAERNSGSKLVGQLMREGQRVEAETQKQRMLQIGGEIEGLEAELATVGRGLQRRDAADPQPAASERAGW